jgi:hypothetical protein
MRSVKLETGIFVADVVKLDNSEFGCNNDRIEYAASLLHSTRSYKGTHSVREVWRSQFYKFFYIFYNFTIVKKNYYKKVKMTYMSLK